MRNLLVLSNVAGFTINDEFMNLVNSLCNGNIYNRELMAPPVEVSDKAIIDFNCGQVLLNWEDNTRRFDALVVDGRNATIDKSFYYTLGMAISRMSSNIQVLCDQTGLELQGIIDSQAKARRTPEEAPNTIKVVSDAKTPGEGEVKLSDSFDWFAKYGYPSENVTIDSDIEPNDPKLQLLLGVLFGYMSIIYNRDDIDPYANFIINKW